MSPATILVADDDRAIRTVLTQALARNGHDVRATGTASARVGQRSTIDRRSRPWTCSSATS